MHTKNHIRPRVNVVTLGCSKNLVDSEVMMGQLQANDFEVVHESGSDPGDVVIINTCGFIDRAKEESINTILEFAEAKSGGRINQLFVTGCLSQRYRDDLQQEIPEVDAWFGTLELPQLLQKLNADYRHELIGERPTVTPQHYAYLKISEGCNRTCAFCAIPLMRGNHVSKSIEVLVSETSNLVRHGVKEVILIAQELTYYGLDIYKKRALSELLTALCAVEGLDWIRLHYAYPAKFPMDILEVMASEQKICNYLDIPLQHANDGVLKRMKRHTDQQYMRELIRNIRSTVPGVALRTTMLVGFPGETEEEFQDLMDFTEEMQFDRLGVFTYSHEEDTGAYNMEDDTPAEVKSERAGRLMALQQNISFEKNQLLVGQELQVLFDRKEGGHFIGRTEYDSPEVDNEVLVNARDHYVRIGDFARVQITDATDFDLMGGVVSSI